LREIIFYRNILEYVPLDIYSESLLTTLSKYVRQNSTGFYILFVREYTFTSLRGRLKLGKL